MPDSPLTDARPPACALCDCPQDLWSFFDLLLIHTHPNSGVFPERKHAVLLSDTGEFIALCLAVKKHLSNYKQTPIKTHGEEQLEG